MILDSNFIIDLLAGSRLALQLAREADESGEVLRIPSPAVFELWAGARHGLSSKKESRQLKSLLEAFEIIPFGGVDVRTSGEMQALLRSEGKSLGTVDVQIASMCVARNEALVTGDRRLAKLGHGLSVRTYE
jgi:predicted nucleic acid-binding protein